jgi:long-chain fatty acid transport protein
MSFIIKALKKFLPAGMVLGSCTGRVLANGFGLPDQDAFATGRGEAFVATADNPSAIYYNPAGISQLNGNNLRGGFYGIYYNPSYRPPAGAANSGNTYHSSYDLAAIPQLFYTHTFTNSMLSLGLGVYAPFGGNIDWPQTTGFRSVATQGKLTYLTINPTVGLKLAPGLSIGGGAMINYVKLSFDQGLISAFPSRINNFYDFRGDGWSAGYNLGALWKPIEQVSFGATFRSSAEVNLKGRSQFEKSPPTPHTTLPAEMDLTFPIVAVVGVSYRPTPKWNLEFDANYTDWASFGTTTIEQQGNFPLGATPNVTDTMDWQASWMYELGVTRYFPRGWHVSAGYTFNQNSVPNAFYTPLAADLDRHFFSIGIGRDSKRFDFDVAYQFGYGPPHTVSGSTPSTSLAQISAGAHPADGTYRFTSDALIVTLGLHF